MRTFLIVCNTISVPLIVNFDGFGCSFLYPISNFQYWLVDLPIKNRCGSRGNLFHRWKKRRHDLRRKNLSGTSLFITLLAIPFQIVFSLFCILIANSLLPPEPDFGSRRCRTASVVTNVVRKFTKVFNLCGYKVVSIRTPLISSAQMMESLSWGLKQQLNRWRSYGEEEDEPESNIAKVVVTPVCPVRLTAASGLIHRHLLSSHRRKAIFWRGDFPGAVVCLCCRRCALGLRTNNAFEDRDWWDDVAMAIADVVFHHGEWKNHEHHG